MLTLESSFSQLIFNHCVDTSYKLVMLEINSRPTTNQQPGFAGAAAFDCMFGICILRAACHPDKYHLMGLA